MCTIPPLIFVFIMQLIKVVKSQHYFNISVSKVRMQAKVFLFWSPCFKWSMICVSTPLYLFWAKSLRSCRHVAQDKISLCDEKTVVSISCVLLQLFTKELKLLIFVWNLFWECLTFCPFCNGEFLWWSVVFL